jgi:CRP/FNR family cyclic AMP-dependent transcriptional regulator
LLALHALGDICGTGLPQATKRPISKAARLLEALESPVEQVETTPALSPELRSLLEKALSNPEPLIQQSAQIALKKIDNPQADDQTGKASLTDQQEQEPVSLVERVIILKEITFFHSISITQLETLAMVCEQKKYEKDARIFKKGDPGGVLYIVVDGQVGIEQEKRIGSALLATIENGSYFGEMSLFDESPRSASATAMKDCFVLELNRAPIIMLTMQNPDLALELINVLSQRIRETSDRIAEAARSRPRELHKLYDQFD